MKTLFKTYTAEMAKNKANEYRARYNVKFDFYHIGDGFRIVPVITRETVPPAAGTPDVDRVLFAVVDSKFGKSFHAIADETDLPIATVISAAQFLIKNGFVFFDVTRNGFIGSIRAKGPRSIDLSKRIESK